MVQWLRRRAFDAVGLGLIPGQGARSHRAQLKVCIPGLKIPHAVIKRFRMSQLRKKKKKVPHAAMKIKDPLRPH